jgi:hypothetical protein
MRVPEVLSIDFSPALIEAANFKKFVAFFFGKLSAHDAAWYKTR